MVSRKLRSTLSLARSRWGYRRGPVLHDLSIRDAEHVDGPHLHPFAGRRYAHELAQMGASLVASSCEVQGAKIDVRLLEPGSVQTASGVSAPCPGMHVIVTTRGTRLNKPRYGGQDEFGHLVLPSGAGDKPPPRLLYTTLSIEVRARHVYALSHVSLLLLMSC